MNHFFLFFFFFFYYSHCFLAASYIVRGEKNGKKTGERGQQERERERESRERNKIGDVEYFALGSSGHFTHHFNP